YHFLGCGFNQTCLVTTSGRLARVTIWVPLARVQSLRRVQGPVQSRLGLASLHLDTAGSRGSAPIPDRDVAEADQMLEQLSTLCRAAREPSHHV
ncbi:MAG TPA: PH domain-containing protein, partial [Candidatus Dormibacteraeota bacterium]|nr:PH domain-containing protein [Candidatus Dormibacteraeota bacterium]